MKKHEENISIILNYEENGKQQELTFRGTVTHVQHDKASECGTGLFQVWVKDVSKFDSYTKDVVPCVQKDVDPK